MCGSEPGESPGLLEAIRAVEDWNEVAILALARRHRATPWLLASVDALDARELIPSKALNGLISDARGRAFESLAQSQSLLEIARVLQANNIPSIVMKGPVVAESFYSGAALRPYSDIDLLVPGQHYAAVGSICTNLGYQVADDHGGPESTHYGTSEAAYETLYVNSSTSSKLDIHYDHLQIGLQPRESAGFWQRSEPWFYAGCELRRPGLNDHFLMLAVHLHKHGFERLIWLKDLDMILRKSSSELDWPWLIGKAREEGTLLSLRMSLDILKRTLVTPLPPQAAKLTVGLANWLARLVWNETTIFVPELRLHPWRRAVQFVPQDGLRGSLPSLVFMGRRLEKMQSLSARLLSRIATAKH
jgi:hypothetical protein